VSAYLKREALDELIAEAGMTNREFAHLAGLSPITLSHARNGRPVRPDTLRRIALGLTRLKPLKGFEGRDLVTGTPPGERSL
jgi:predicted transcriptional regulator